MSIHRTVASEIASRLIAIENCRASGNDEWLERHTRTLQAIVTDYLPSGSGFDNGTRIVREKSNAARLVFETSYHHMDDVGGYDGWTEHTVTLRATFNGPRISISGSDRNRIKEDIAEVFLVAMDEPVTDDYLIRVGS